MHNLLGGLLCGLLVVLLDRLFVLGIQKAFDCVCGLFDSLVNSLLSFFFDLLHYPLGSRCFIWDSQATRALPTCCTTLGANILAEDLMVTKMLLAIAVKPGLVLAFCWISSRFRLLGWLYFLALLMFLLFLCFLGFL